MRADLARNAWVIEREIGRKPRTTVWPYGSYNDELVNMVGELGGSITLTLGDGKNSADVPLTAVRRTLVEHNPALAEFVVEVHGPQSPEPLRGVRVSLDDVYSANPEEQERNLSALLDRVQVLKPTHVYLQATTDTDGDGVVDAVYFPNRHLPVRADLFNRAAWQLMSRTDADVLAVLPANGFDLSGENIVEVYEDLASYASFSGLLFDEAAKPGTLSGTPSVEFTRLLAARAHAFRAPLMIARSLPVSPYSTPAQNLRFGETLREYLAAYDQVVLTTVADAAETSDAWLLSVAEAVRREPAPSAAQRKVLFMLHKPTTNSGQVLSDNALARQMRVLQLGGVLNFAYGLDDFRNDDPPLSKIAPVMSLRIFMQQTDQQRTRHD